MKRWRYLIAAAVAAGSMAAGAGAIDTADRDALLETAVAAGSMAAGAGAIDTADRDALLETAVARERPETASMV